MRVQMQYLQTKLYLLQLNSLWQQPILSTDVPGGGGGGTAPADTGTPAPEMLSGRFTLGGGEETQPVQAYVVTDDMTNNQNKLANIRRRATI